MTKKEFKRFVFALAATFLSALATAAATRCVGPGHPPMPQPPTPFNPQGPPP